MEHSIHIPDDLPTCQKLLRSAWERVGELERQLDEFVATTEELKRAQACSSVPEGRVPGTEMAALRAAA